MHSLAQLARGAGITGLLILAATPAFAGEKTNRARQAIAEATGKVDAANKLGVSGEVPHLTARAQAALRTAREDLARGRKEQAIDEANQASQLADTAIGEAQRNRIAAERAEHDNAAAAADAAHHEAAVANERAQNAEQAAASAAADAAAARAAPPPAPVIIQTPAPAPTTTTVTTESVKQASVTHAGTTTHRRVVRHVVRRKPVATAHAVHEKTTTTVTTRSN